MHRGGIVLDFLVGDRHVVEYEQVGCDKNRKGARYYSCLEHRTLGNVLVVFHLEEVLHLATDSAIKLEQTDDFVSTSESDYLIHNFVSELAGKRVEYGVVREVQNLVFAFVAYFNLKQFGLQFLQHFLLLRHVLLHFLVPQNDFAFGELLLHFFQNNQHV